jgi:hypothetical protein
MVSRTEIADDLKDYRGFEAKIDELSSQKEHSNGRLQEINTSLLQAKACLSGKVANDELTKILNACQNYRSYYNPNYPNYYNFYAPNNTPYRAY